MGPKSQEAQPPEGVKPCHAVVPGARLLDVMEDGVGCCCRNDRKWYTRETTGESCVAMSSVMFGFCVYIYIYIYMYVYIYIYAEREGERRFRMLLIGKEISAFCQ